MGDAFTGRRSDAVLRVGRQELNYGDGRLIAARIGPNIRSDWDGLLLRILVGRVTTDVIAFRAVADRSGIFDNAADPGNKIGGFYSSAAGERMNFDFLYLTEERKDSPYAFTNVLLSETRNTMGVRLWSSATAGRSHVDLGANVQNGSARGVAGSAMKIRAWSLAGSVERRVAEGSLAPAIGIEVGLTSGDHNPGDRTLGTFRSIAPTGRLTGLADSFGPGNLVGMRPYLEFHPSERLRVRPKATWFWRMRETDGLYTLAPGVISRPASGSRFAGTEPSLELEWRVNDHWTVTGFASHFMVGRGIGETSLRRDVSYLEATLSLKF